MHDGSVRYLMMTSYQVSQIKLTTKLLERKHHAEVGYHFGIIFLIAAALGFGGIAGAAGGIAKVLFFVFLAVCVVLLIPAVVAGTKPARN